MKNLFISPASRDNLESSVENHVDLETIRRNVAAHDYEKLHNASPDVSGFQCWGMKESMRNNYFEAMQPGDIVLIKENKKTDFGYQAEVIYKAESKTFGREIWRSDEWELIYFFKSVQRISIPFEKFKQAVGYQSNFQLQGQKRIADDKVLEIIKKYGSLDSFLKSLLMGNIIPIVPSARKQPPKVDPEPVIIRLEWLKSNIERREQLNNRAEFSERDVEDIVKDFFLTLGYSNKQIQFHNGRVDIQISDNEGNILIVEAKKNLQRERNNALDQAYRYAQTKGARFVIITDGDYYEFYDREGGLSTQKNFVSSIQLTRLTRQDDVNFLEKMRDRIRRGEIPYERKTK